MKTDANEPVRRSFPERIGRYQILDRIGRGAMGVVYRALDDVMRREVALKVLTADLEDDADIKTRFHREAQAAAQLQHPNIINILDVGEDGHRFYIVMELLRGAPLKEYLKTQPVTLDQKLDLMMQLCAGIQAAHRADIFHRDIKPGNLFVRVDGILKILDFGVARLASSNMTASGFIVGTPDYMSPEQACGTEVDARSDIFSIGGVCYYMLAGRKPFASTHLPTLFQQVLNEMPQPLVDVPQPLADLVMKALAKSPDARPQTCEEMRLALEQLRRELREMPAASVTSVAAGPAGARLQPAVSVSAVPGTAANAAVAMPAEQPSDTEDTVVLGLAGAATVAVDTDDTVHLVAQPSWWQDTTERWMEMAALAMSRIKRAVTPVTNVTNVTNGDNPDARKRSL